MISICDDHSQSTHPLQNLDYPLEESNGLDMDSPAAAQANGPRPDRWTECAGYYVGADVKSPQKLVKGELETYEKWVEKHSKGAISTDMETVGTPDAGIRYRRYKASTIEGDGPNRWSSTTSQSSSNGHSTPARSESSGQNFLSYLVRKLVWRVSKTIFYILYGIIFLDLHLLSRKSKRRSSLLVSLFTILFLFLLSTLVIDRPVGDLPLRGQTSWNDDVDMSRWRDRVEDSVKKSIEELNSSHKSLSNGEISNIIEDIISPIRTQIQHLETNVKAVDHMSNSLNHESIEALRDQFSRRLDESLEKLGLESDEKLKDWKEDIEKTIEDKLKRLQRQASRVESDEGKPSEISPSQLDELRDNFDSAIRSMEGKMGELSDIITKSVASFNEGREESRDKLTETLRRLEEISSRQKELEEEARQLRWEQQNTADKHRKFDELSESFKLNQEKFDEKFHQFEERQSTTEKSIQVQETEREALRREMEEEREKSKQKSEEQSSSQQNILDQQKALEASLHQLQEKQRESEHKVHSHDPQTPTDTPPLNLLENQDQLEDLIDRRIDAAVAGDRLLKIDYALQSAGGAIDTRTHYTSPPYRFSTNWLGYLMSQPTPPSVIITPGVEIGKCWAFAGQEGRVSIRLAQAIWPTSFTMEHASASVSLGGASSAPHNFSVWGLNSTLLEPVLLGQYVYEIKGRYIQQFDVQDVAALDHGPFHIITVHITSNHGNPDFTCLYRFRVHSEEEELKKIGFEMMEEEKEI
ncbi:SUN domain-containing protein 2-like [Planoprotostelium fungivorum]|uniref:SUN domain-containing protein 2-like n=1 Tax=Planoprotostelium fungivorum TaxID=1890364 RepID=A0A2P6NZK6_9EUKA|nr:SUN domain-containing protein 2-like [Planoprotostelium fungivorum]